MKQQAVEEEHIDEEFTSGEDEVYFINTDIKVRTTDV